MDLIIPKNNPRALGIAINMITSNSDKAKPFGEEGYKKAIQNFTPRNIIQFDKLYNQL